jgi:cytosine/uracil/thiamine/allantoin permease
VNRQILVRIGVGLTTAGLLAALGAFVLPWLSYTLLARRLPAGVAREGSLSLFEVPRGKWFVAALVILMVLVALAAFGRGRARQVGGLAAPVVGLVAAALVVWTLTASGSGHVAAHLGLPRVNASVSGGAGGWLAVAAAAFLCFAGGLFSLGRYDR